MNDIYRNYKHLAIFALLAFSLSLSGCGSSPKYTGSKSKQSVVAAAKRMLGVKYRYGGTSPKRGFDCSGLVQYSHKAAGIKLPRTTGQQYKHSKWIARKYLTAGDLVFFKTSVSKSVSHVGIYLGNNKFIHAPSSGKRVKINSMKERYWRKRFTGGGRVL